MFYSRRCVFCRTISLPNFNGLRWIECMTSSVSSFAYFTQFSNLNISGTDAGICKCLNAFSIFHRILCDTPKKSRGKNLITVAL